MQEILKNALLKLFGILVLIPGNPIKNGTENL